MADEFNRRSDPGYPKTGERRRRRKSNYVGKKPPLMILEKKDERKVAPTSPRNKIPNLRKRRLLESKLDERRLELNRRNNMLIRAKKNTQKIVKPPVLEFSHGGEAKVRGMGAAIKGGKFEGVF